MKKFAPIFGLALVAALMIHDAYEFVVTNEGLRYYSSQPRRLLYVVALALGGGLGALLFSRCSPQVQRGLKLSVLGIFASTFTVFLGLFVSWGFYFGAISSIELLTAKEGALMIAPVVLCGATAAYVWFEFAHVWKNGKTRFI